MKNHFKYLLAGCVATGLLTGCASAGQQEEPDVSEKTTETIAKAEEKVEEKAEPEEIVLGTRQEGREEIPMTNKTGHSLSGWAVSQAGLEEPAWEEMMDEDEVIKKDAGFVWVPSVKEGESEGAWDVKLILDDGSEVILYDLDLGLAQCKDIHVCLETVTAYLTYTDEQGEACSTLETQLERTGKNTGQEAAAEETPEEYAQQGAQEEVGSEELVSEEPVYQEPAYQEPGYQEPVYQEPIYQEPVYEPVYQEPIYQEPVYEAPIFNSGSSEGCLGDTGW